MAKEFVPTDFEIPDVLETNRFRLRMLTVHDARLDYDAVITSIEHLRKTKPFGPNHSWPANDLSYEQDLMDLERHQKEFQNRTSFAFTVMNPDETECLGCVYIDPSGNPDYDAMVVMWVRQSQVASGLDEILFSTVKKWIQDKWPFGKVAYPGRDVTWDEFTRSCKVV